ncbi:MAG: Xaa-Pro aminopeptidase [Pseudomonadota bacterium]|jgi:Xaa-Pro aminopeptidase
MADIFAKRIRRVGAHLRGLQFGTALLVTSAPGVIRSRDTQYPYRQNSDFYYLTGADLRDSTLLVSPKRKRPLVLAPKPDPVKVVWEGAPLESAEQLAKRLGADLVRTDDVWRALSAELRGIDELVHQNIPGSVSWSIARRLLELPAHARSGMPARFAHSDTVLEEMRLYKEPSEVKLIKEAAAITNHALFETLPFVLVGQKESTIAATVEYWFRLQGATAGFNTIAATGQSAATLHYEHQSRALKRDDLLLIDCGAEHRMYSADITRVVPVRGVFSGVTREVYEIVLAAQKAAMKAVKNNVLIQKVYDAAAHELTVGLVELGVLRGKVSALLGKKAYKPYFPHGIGHSLGLDVHDVGNLRGNNAATLKTGMVFTIEPGLYFPKRVKNVPSCGVRIEDDILVTPRRAEILSAGFPKEVREIEALFGDIK